MKNSSFYLAIALVLSLAVGLSAGVVIKQVSNIESGGFVKMEIASVQYVKGDKSCDESSTKMTGGMMAKMGSQMENEFAQITRLDKKVM